MSTRTCQATQDLHWLAHADGHHLPASSMRGVPALTAVYHGEPSSYPTRHLELLQVGQDLVGGPYALGGAAFHEALEVDRAVLAGEVNVSLPRFLVSAEAGVLAWLPV